MGSQTQGVVVRKSESESRVCIYNGLYTIDNYQFHTPETARRLVRVKDCGIVWVDGYTASTNRCVFGIFSGWGGHFVKSISYTTDYPNDPMISHSYQSPRSFWSGEFISMLELIRAPVVQRSIKLILD